MHGLLYLLSYICGGLFSCVMSLSPWCRYFWDIRRLFWIYCNQLEYNKMNYLMIFIFMILIVVMNASFGLGSEIIDNYGHFDRLIYEFLFIFLLAGPKNGNNNSLWLSFDIWKKYATVTIAISIILLSFR